MLINNQYNFLFQFNEIVKKYPNNIAILEDGIKETTYYELYENALKVCNYLQRNYLTDIIGIEISKSSEYIASILGCWYAKKAFVPIDKNYPQARKNFIIEDASIGFILDDSKYTDALKEEILIKDSKIEQDRPAYIFYTSGSTGKPKGVLVSHNGIVNLSECQSKAFKVDSSSKYLFYVSTNFDASISDICATLLSGATLVIEKEAATVIASKLFEFIEARKITHIDIPPSLLKILDINKKPNSLKTIVIGGEICDIKTAQRWAEKVNLINVYGPTEATVCTSLCKCTPDWKESLIGDVISNIEYMIVDSNFIPSSKGELLISGVGLAIGYINNEELNKKKFIILDNKRYYRTGDCVELLKNGSIKFLGRIDRQVKIRGQLVELEEIETKLNSHPLITKSIVQKRKIHDNSKENLVAFVEVLACNKNLTSETLKDYLKMFLPSWMIPVHFEILDKLPTTSSGKIDSSKLNIISTIKAQYDAPTTAKEQLLVDIFKKIAQAKDVGVNDSFFDIGGDSLGIIECVYECDKIGLKISPQAIIEKQTPRAILASLNSSPTIKMCVSDLSNDMDFKENSFTITQNNNIINNILITGTTGFLGSSLIIELLQNSNYTIYCLIRSKDKIDAKKRLTQTLKNYGLFIDDFDRVKFVCGDIEKDNFGLDNKEYDKLSDKIDVVYHCAAKVNMVLSYEQLKNVNLNGTKRILNFCLHKKQKTLHYASTLSVFVSTDKNEGIAYESDRLNNIEYIFGGYGQTKFAAEKYLLNVPTNICNIFIYRFGLITGNSQSGICASNDFLGMFISGANQLGKLPFDESNLLEVDITPIDYAAKAMAKISISDTDKRIFHIANNQALKYNDFIKILKEEKIIDEIINFEEFQKIIKNKNTQSSMTINEQSCILGLCRLNLEKYEEQKFMDLFQATNIKFNDENTKSVIDFKCPKCDAKLINKYINNERKKW